VLPRSTPIRPVRGDVRRPGDRPGLPGSPGQVISATAIAMPGSAARG